MALPQRPSQGAFRVGHVRAEESGLAFWEPLVSRWKYSACPMT